MVNTPTYTYRIYIHARIHTYLLELMQYYYFLTVVLLYILVDYVALDYLPLFIEIFFLECYFRNELLFIINSF